MAAGKWRPGLRKDQVKRIFYVFKVECAHSKLQKVSHYDVLNLIRDSVN